MVVLKSASIYGIKYLRDIQVCIFSVAQPIEYIHPWRSCKIGQFLGGWEVCSLNIGMDRYHLYTSTGGEVLALGFQLQSEALWH